MKKLALAFVLCLCFALRAWGQIYTSVSTSSAELSNGFGINGQLCFLGTDSTDTPITYYPGGGSTGVSTPVCSPLTSGIVTTFNVANIATAVGLRMASFGPAVVNVLHRQVQLVLVMFTLPAVFRAAIRSAPAAADVMLLEERQYPVIEQIRRHQRVLAIIKLSESDLGIGVSVARFCKRTSGSGH